MIDMMTVTHIASRYAPYSMSGVAAGRTATFTFEGEGAEERAEEFVDDLRVDRLIWVTHFKSSVCLYSMPPPVFVWLGHFILDAIASASP